MPRGQAELAASDVGPGNRISVHASADELAALDSAPFPIIGGAKYDVTFTARIPAAARNGGYFVLAFRDSVDYLQAPGPSPGTPHSESIPLMPGRVELGTATTDGQGNYHLAVPSLAGGAVIDASYAGDGGHWPAAASLPPPP